MEAALEQSAWRRQAPDLSGRWERDSSQNVEDCVSFLEAHGHDTVTAVSKVRKQFYIFFNNHALHVMTYIVFILHPCLACGGALSICSYMHR